MAGERVGFFEESPGVRSSTRLGAGLLVVGCLILSFAAAFAAIHDPKDAPPVISALGVPIGALAAGAWGAFKARSTE